MKHARMSEGQYMAVEEKEETESLLEEKHRNMPVSGRRSSA